MIDKDKFTEQSHCHVLENDIERSETIDYAINCIQRSRCKLYCYKVLNALTQNLCTTLCTWTSDSRYELKDNLP